MELDKRIKEGKKPLDCFDIAKAKQFIGKKGLFGTCILQFKNLDTCPKCVVDELKRIANFSEDPFVTSGNHAYMYFLPEEWLKEPEEWLKELEKKYKPYSLELWTHHYDIGEIIHFRRTGCAIEHHMMFTGYDTEAGTDMTAYGIGAIILGGNQYAFQTLFERYEIMINDKWQPFGTEVKEKE